jgi:tripartite-type tricarboxylate transporter receptor subunit TctC
MIRILGAALAALTLAATAMPAGAQPYPNKPIRMIVPVPPGSLTDVIARRIAGEASTILGQPFITENRPGANFMPGAEACRHSRGDGYTVCVFTTSTLTFNPHLIDNIPYNAEKDFKPVINLGTFAGGLVVSPKLAVKSLDELKAYALANPGKLNFGTYGPASSANVFRRYLNDLWKTDIVEVAYKGANELVAALINGELHMTWTALGNWADNPNEAKGRILVQDGDKRSAKLPNVPTYREGGLGDYPIVTWMGLFAPGETPDAIVTQLNAAFAKAITDPKVSEFLTNQIIAPKVTSAAQFAATIAKEREETGKIFRKYNIPKIQ